MKALVVAPRAEAQIRAIGEWWRTNRPAAQELFALELAAALEAIAEAPGMGARHRIVCGVLVRRMLLPRSRYHVYFWHDPACDLVEVLAVWHGSRGRGPLLQ